MQAKAKLTSKGQITLPSIVRKRMRLDTGDMLIFESKGKQIVISPQREENLFSEFRGSGTPGVGPGRKAVLEWVREARGEL
jgi:AbrB family looped-hinge helix DNA binding protein